MQSEQAFRASLMSVRIRLAVGPDLGRRIFASVFLVALLLVELFFLVMGVVAMRALYADGVNVGVVLGTPLVAGLILFVMYMFGVFACIQVVKIRYAMWLDGTVLAERLVLRRKSVDLSTANIRIKSTASGVESLIAVDATSGMEIELPARMGGCAIPAVHALHLADAIVRSRTGATCDDQSLAAAQWFRALAQPSP